MAKTMARLENNIIINFDWCSDAQSETDILKNIYDYNLNFGDTYKDGFWYRDNQRILTNTENFENTITALSKENRQLTETNTKLTEENQQAKAANEELLNNLNIMKLNQEQAYQEGVNSI